VGDGGFGEEPGFWADCGAGLVGEFFAPGLEGDAGAVEALGCAGAAGFSPRVWGVCAGAPGEADIPRRGQRVFRRVQGDRAGGAAGDCVAADWGVSPGFVSAIAHGAGRGDQGVQGSEGEVAGADALRDVPVVV